MGGSRGGFLATENPLLWCLPMGGGARMGHRCPHFGGFCCPLMCMARCDEKGAFCRCTHVECAMRQLACLGTALHVVFVAAAVDGSCCCRRQLPCQLALLLLSEAGMKSVFEGSFQVPAV